jgi:hypothetical protein
METDGRQGDWLGNCYFSICFVTEIVFFIVFHGMGMKQREI